MSNDDEVHRELRGCVCSKDHEHQVLSFGVMSQARKYPEKAKRKTMGSAAIVKLN